MAMTLDGSNGVTFNDSSLQGAAASPYGLKNRIINGDMRIDQRNAGASVTPLHTNYLLDRWTTIITQNSKYSVQQNAGSVTPPDGFKNYIGFTSSSAYSVLSSDYFIVMQKIEGFNVADLMWGSASAKTITIGFWTRSSLTGNFGACVSNNGWARNYPFTYTINAANTWEFKTVTIQGDTTGTWATDNGTGIILNFSLGAGSGFMATANTWTSSYGFQPTGSVNLVGTNGATLYITGVQLEVGSTATPFERRMYGQELALCQRYLPAGGFNGALYAGQCQSTSQASVTIPFQVTPRVAPTGVTVNSPTLWGLTNATGAGIAASTVVFGGASLVAAHLNIALPSASLVAGNATGAYASSAIAFFTGCEL